VLRRWSSRTNLKLRDISRMIVTTAAANPAGDPGRVSQQLIDVIKCLNNGQIPRSSDQF
jgi:hypothetical protein